MLTGLLAFFLVGLAGLVAVIVFAAVVGVMFSVVFGLVSVLLFKVLPLLIVGWIVYKLVQRSGSRRSLSGADQRWLDEA
jgi:hypothetical protein